MDISSKIKALREEAEKLSAEEKLIKARIAELKTVLAEKKKQEEQLAALKKEEAELLKLLA
jgi:septal ring factor EnvC (AmiA/AmiB activator)